MAESIQNPLVAHRFERGLFGRGRYCAVCGLTEDAVVHPKNGHNEAEYQPQVSEGLTQSPGFNPSMIEQGARLILQGLGVDIADHNFATTPKRMVEVYREMFVPEKTGWPVFDEEYTDVVIVRNHTFWTLCPHHMLPVQIRAAVGYFPNGKVIGASKLMRLIDEVNTKPQTQEKLTDLICDSIKRHTGGSSGGEAVLLEGKHGCFEIRGKKSHASMVTVKFKGRFDEPENQRRFLEMAK